jgi:hypothetical protein
MLRTLTIAAVSAAVLLLSPAAFAQQTGGTADEAKAMLMKAAAAVKGGQDQRFGDVQQGRRRVLGPGLVRLLQ